MKQLYKVSAFRWIDEMSNHATRPAAMAGLFASREEAVEAAVVACEKIFEAYAGGKVLGDGGIEVTEHAYDLWKVTRPLVVEVQRSGPPVTHSIIHEGETYTRVTREPTTHRASWTMEFNIEPAGFLITTPDEAVAAVPAHIAGWSWSRPGQ